MPQTGTPRAHLAYPTWNRRACGYHADNAHAGAAGAHDDDALVLEGLHGLALHRQRAVQPRQRRCRRTLYW